MTKKWLTSSQLWAGAFASVIGAGLAYDHVDSIGLKYSLMIALGLLAIILTLAGVESAP